jgi:hypothetical protein
MRRAALCAIFLSLIAGAPSARADGDKSYGALAITKTDEASQTDQGKAEHAITVIDLGVGINAGSGLIIGGRYFDYSLDDKLLSDTGSTITGYGPMVGYLHDKTLLFANAAYLLGPTKDIKSGAGTTTFSGGSGYLITVGKAFEINKSFGMALQVTQSQVSYKSVKDVNGTSTSLVGTWQDTSLLPYLAACVFF